MQGKSLCKCLRPRCGRLLQSVLWAQQTRPKIIPNRYTCSFTRTLSAPYSHSAHTVTGVDTRKSRGFINVTRDFCIVNVETFMEICVSSINRQVGKAVVSHTRNRQAVAFIQLHPRVSSSFFWSFGELVSICKVDVVNGPVSALLPSLLSFLSLLSHPAMSIPGLPLVFVIFPSKSSSLSYSRGLVISS